MRRSSAPIACAVVAMAVSGCGGGGGGGSGQGNGSESPRATAEQFRVALSKADAKTVCSLLNARGVKTVAGTGSGSCEARVKPKTVNGGLFRSVRIGRVVQKGDTAVAILVVAPGAAGVTLTKDALELRRQNGRWFIEGGHKSTAAERGAKDPGKITACLQKAKFGVQSYGGTPAAYNVTPPGFRTKVPGGAYAWAKLLMYPTPEEAKKAPVESGYAQRPRKISGNVLLQYYVKHPPARIRGAIENCL